MITFTPLKIEDLPFLLEIRNNPSTRENLEDNREFSLEECESWFRLTKPAWFLVKNQEDKKVGYFRVKGSDIGCDIHPEHRRKGYARQAFKEYLKKVDYATLWVFEDNFAKTLYESLGFRESGETKLVRGKSYVKMIYVFLV
jgi:ribosomal protein S18 acetylase RimI-like enzyme